MIDFLFDVKYVSSNFVTCESLYLLTQNFLKNIRKNNKHRGRYECLASNCDLFEAYVDWCLKCSQNFCDVFRKNSCPFPARIFISPTSITPIFLQLFFRETLGGNFVEKKTLTTTFPNNLRSISSKEFNNGLGGGMTEVTSQPPKGASTKIFCSRGFQ